MEDDILANAITYIPLLRVKSFPKVCVTVFPLKWYHSLPLAHALYYRRTLVKFKGDFLLHLLVVAFMLE